MGLDREGGKELRLRQVARSWQIKTSILLADDDENFRECLQKFLEPEFRVVASVGDGQALIETAHSLVPDLIITDISMPGLNGVQAIRRLKPVAPRPRVIFLTIQEDHAFLVEARKLNVLGYVLKRCALSDLIPAIREALQGKPFVSPALME